MDILAAVAVGVILLANVASMLPYLRNHLLHWCRRSRDCGLA